MTPDLVRLAKMREAWQTGLWRIGLGQAREPAEAMAWQHAFREGVKLLARGRSRSRSPGLVDGENYFRAFKQAALSAQRSILIVGWDVNSRNRARISPTTPWPAFPTSFGPFLDYLLKRSRELAHPHVLELGFALALSKA